MFSVCVKKAQFDSGGVCGEQRKIYTIARPRCTARIREAVLDAVEKI
jgi:hypothetical protein